MSVHCEMFLSQSEEDKEKKHSFISDSVLFFTYANMFILKQEKKRQSCSVAMTFLRCIKWSRNGINCTLYFPLFVAETWYTVVWHHFLIKTISKATNKNFKLLPWTNLPKRLNSAIKEKLIYHVIHQNPFARKMKQIVRVTSKTSETSI